MADVLFAVEYLWWDDWCYWTSPPLFIILVGGQSTSFSYLVFKWMETAKKSRKKSKYWGGGGQWISFLVRYSIFLGLLWLFSIESRACWTCRPAAWDPSGCRAAPFVHHRRWRHQGMSVITRANQQTKRNPPTHYLPSCVCICVCVCRREICRPRVSYTPRQYRHHMLRTTTTYLIRLTFLFLFSFWRFVLDALNERRGGATPGGNYQGGWNANPEWKTLVPPPLPPPAETFFFYRFCVSYF